MRKVINFMSLMKESSFFLDIHFPNPEVFCKVFKDNQSCIAIVEANKSLPKAKYIDIKYHHFLSFIPNNFVDFLVMGVLLLRPQGYYSKIFSYNVFFCAVLFVSARKHIFNYF